MTDWLVKLQETLAEYPSWAVAGGVGFVIAVVFILIGKALRVVGVALLVGVVIAGGWFVWERMSGRESPSAPAAQESLSPSSPNP